jgi:hypothetical protein
MSSESRKKAGVNISKTKQQNKEKYSGENHARYGMERTPAEKFSISNGTKEAMKDPVLKLHLSTKAKLRCTPEWKALRSEESQRKVCTYKLSQRND